MNWKPLSRLSGPTPHAILNAPIRKLGPASGADALTPQLEQKEKDDVSLGNTAIPNSQELPMPRRGNHYGAPLETAIEGDALVIRIGIQTLAHAASYAEWANPFDEQADDYIRTFAITDARQFADDVRHAMLAEREDGSSPLSDFIDKASSDAVDDGSTGTEDARIKHGETDPRETWAERNDEA